MFYRHVVNLMEKRGVSLEAIGEIVYELQRPYNDTLSLDECVESVSHVLKKREVQNALLTGIAIDKLAEAKKLPQPLQTMMEIDEPLYGVDEIMALSIINVYGSIGLTSFGYLDKIKVGVLKRLNHRNDQIHVFLDDLVAGVAAAASARIAHRHPDMQRYAADMDESTGLDEEG